MRAYKYAIVIEINAENSTMFVVSFFFLERILSCITNVAYTLRERARKVAEMLQKGSRNVAARCHKGSRNVA